MKALLAVVALVLAGALCWLAFGTGAPAPGPGAPEEIEVPGEAAPPTASAGLETPEADPAGDEAGDVAEAARQKLELEGAGDTDEDLTEITVQVVDKESGQPVPGAEVLYARKQIDWEEIDAELKKQLQRLQVDPEAQLRLYGQSVFADDEGRVELGFVGRWNQVVARKGDRYGQLQVNLNDRPPKEGWRIELEEDVGFDVRVVDGAGDPVPDIGVTAGFEVFRARNQKVQDGRNHVGTSDEKGMVRARHVQRWRVHEKDGHRTAEVKVSVTGHEGEGEKVDLGDLPEKPVELVCPPLGVVLVRAVGAGTSLENNFWCELKVVGSDGKQSQGSWGNERREDGRLEFKNVALGLTLAVSSWMGGEMISEKLAGPVRAGQEVEVVLEQKGESIVLVGRAVEEGGESLGKSHLMISFQAGTSQNTEHTRCDEDGAFQVALNKWWAGKSTDAIRVHLLGDDWQPTGRVGIVPFSGELRPGVFDLGEITLAEAPIVVTGRVVDDRDEPVERGVHLYIEEQYVRTPEKNPRPAWRYSQTLPVTLGKDGEFEVRGRAPEVELRLRAGSEDYLHLEPIEFVAGQRDLVVRLSEGGTLMAEVEHDALIPAASLRLELIPQGPEVSAAEAGFSPFGGGNRKFGQAREPEKTKCAFRWRGLSPGQYDLRVRPFAADGTTLLIPDIVIRSGDDNEDPRLHPIDLRGQLRKIVVRVLDSAGQPVRSSQGGVLIIKRDAKADLEGHRLNGGEVSFLMSEPYVDLMIGAPGYRTQELRGVRDSVDVTMRPELKVEVEVVRPDVELPEGVSVRVSLAIVKGQRDPRRLRLGGWGNPFDVLGNREVGLKVGQDGRASAGLVRPGTYAISVSLQKGNTRVSVEATPAEVRVEALDTVQRVRVEVSEQSLRERLGEL